MYLFESLLMRPQLVGPHGPARRPEIVVKFIEL